MVSWQGPVRDFGCVLGGHHTGWRGSRVSDPVDVHRSDWRAYGTRGTTVTE